MLKNPIFILAIVLALAAGASAQTGGVSNPDRPRPVATLPALPCVPRDFLQAADTGTSSICAKDGLSWGPVNTAATPGTVTSVSGTANQVNVATGTTTPVLSLSSSLVAPGTVEATTSVKSPFFFSAAANPADAGAIRLGNAECVEWEKFVAGTDWTLCVNTADELESTANIRAPTFIGALSGNASTATNGEVTTNKDATGGYTGLTLFKINFKNAANTFTSFFTNANSAARTYTFQNRDGTIADDTDLAGKQNSITFGTGVQTALGVNVGSAGAPVVNGGALGSPSTAGTIPAFTLGGAIAGGGNQINNVIIGTTTPLAAFYTTLSATGTLIGVDAVFTPAGTSGNGVAINSSTVTSGNTVAITASGTAAASNTKTALNVATSGANSTSAMTTYGVQATNTSTGTTSVNVAGYFSASGGASNNGLIVAAGNTGIGTATPLNFVHIKKAGSATYFASDTVRIDGGGSGLRAELHFTDSVTSDALISFKGSATGSARSLSISPSAVETDLFLRGDGNNGVGNSSPTATWDITGTLKASSTTTLAGALVNSGITADTAHTDSSVCQDTTTHQFYSGTGTLGVCLGTSSIRFKTGWNKLQPGLGQIMNLRPGSFYYRQGYGDSGARLNFGYKAEDVVQVLPTLVGLDKDGKPNSVDILGMVPVLTRALQELNAKVETLSAKVVAQQRTIRRLQRQR